MTLKEIKKITTQGNRRIVNIPKKSALKTGDYVLISKIDLDEIGRTQK